MDHRQRQRAQGEATRRAILDAAAAMAREKGFHAMSIRDVCAAAGVTTGAFYHHFKSKDDLLDQGFASLDVYLERALGSAAGAPPLERLAQLLQSYAAFMEEQGPRTVSLYYTRRLADPSASSMDPSRYTLRTMQTCLADLAREGILAPQFSPEWAAEFFFRHFRGMVIDWVLHRGGYPLWPALEQDYLQFQRMFRA